MAYRTVNYATCHRCKGANDRGSQRTCTECNRTIQKEFRENRRRELETLRARNEYLELRNAELLAKLVAAEAIADSFRVRKVSREMGTAAA